MVNKHRHGTPQEYRELYTPLAAKYDRAVSSFVLLGARVRAYRRTAVRELRLKPGSTALDVACGTGLSFSYIENEIGPAGRIVGVDITPAMLSKAKEKVDRHGWKNVELLEADVNQLDLPQSFDGAVCCHALSLMPAYKGVIRRMVKMLNIGGRLVVMDVGESTGVWKFMNDLLAWLQRPFYIGDKKEGPSHKSYLVMKDLLSDVVVKTYYLGQIYIASGTKTRD
jgi:ubiquinone/menaquinone biosynthesis C-methylase UbiE